MSDALVLIKFAGLISSGVSLEKSLKQIGGIPRESLPLRYLLEIAVDSGAAVAKEIFLVAELLTQNERFQDRIEVAYASPKASARLVLWLPLITLALGQLVGLDIIGAVANRPALLISFAAGVLLLLVAKAISNRFINRAQPLLPHIGFYLLGVSLQSSAGANLSQAQHKALVIYKDVFGTNPSPEELGCMKDITNLVEQSGARVGDLLRGESEALQRQVLVRNELKIEKLGIRLMIPLGLAVLPAFVLLSVVPLMFSMLGPK